jgi:uncharacterized protein (DUF1015 family)
MRDMTAGPTSSDPVDSGSLRSSPLPRPAGLVLSPFRALRFDPAVAGDLALLTSGPYDVLSADDVAALEASSEHNVVRLILPRADPASGQDGYERAAATLAAWRSAGVLRPDESPALYVYEQSSADHVQRGLVGALGLAQPDDGIVLPHEDTMAGPVQDRLALYTAVQADLEPIFLVYDGGGAASRAVADVSDVAPLVDVVLRDGLRHRLWALADPALLADIAADLLPRRALIADGHHRYATYLRRQAERHAAGAGDGPWDSGLCLLVDATAFGPQVHPIHRVVPGVDVDDLALRAAGGMAVRPLEGGLDAAVAALAEAGKAGPAYLLAAGDGARLHLLTEPDPAQLAGVLPKERSAAWKALDVSVLHAYVISSLWGLQDAPDVVGYEHDVAGALTAARRTGGTAVLLNPTPVAAVAAVAGAGERMPRKSTLFTPKPATGLVLRDYRDA